jgi:DNA topoisomerase-1
MRNGGEEGKGVGATNMPMASVTVKGDTVRMQFAGKGGVAQDVTVKDKLFASYVRGRQEEVGTGRGADGEVDARARLFPHTADATLEYQKRIGGGRFKVHDLRTHVGSSLAKRLAQDMVENGLRPTTAKEQKAAIKLIATAVSQKLGNTPTVALKSYIHPAALAPLTPAAPKAKKGA